MSDTSGYKLTDRDKQMLVFERSWFKYSGAREQAIYDRFDMSMTRYYQILLGLLEQPAALKFDPLTVNRLRDQRDRKKAARSGLAQVEQQTRRAG